MEAEIRAQPSVLSSNADRYLSEATQYLQGRDFEMALLVARGSSDNAALYMRYLIEVYLKIPVSLAAPSVLTRFGSRIKYPPCLAIGISQSGAAPDVSEVIGELRRGGHATVALTNTEDSRLSHEAECTILLGAGEEKSVAATKTYTATLLALYQMVRSLTGELPEASLPDDNTCQFCLETAEKSLGAVLRSDRWFALARGFSFASAQETALKMMECALLPFKAFSSADFQHGPRALASHGTMAVVYGEAVEGLAGSGCLVEQAPKSAPGPSAPISEILYGQWLALLAARARGLDPDKPHNLSKVTKTL